MNYSKTDHFNGKKFHNLDPTLKGGKNLFHVLKWRFLNPLIKWPRQKDDALTPELSLSIKKDECAITWVNHATALVQFEGFSALTDPVFSKRVSPISWLGPKRVKNPGLMLSELPKIDVVVISHNHYDHMDLASIKTIWHMYQPLIIVPLGNAQIIRSLGIDKVLELDWWGSHQFSDAHQVILTPAQHWSARGIFDRYKALWGGFIIKSFDIKVFFAGDTGYNSHFKMIRKRFGKMDFSLLPIGAYEPRWFMKDNHMNPSEAVKAHVDLESQMSMGIHFDTFQLSNEAIDDPVKDLNKSLAKHSISPEIFIAPKIGQTVLYKKTL
jgi:L-ascorbate metabolism protein UlaG (beta-lactamase superfamily)